jgi:hypothetical protein
MQHEGTLLGLYAVPEKVKVRNREFDYPYHKLYAPFPATGSILKRSERDGWVFCHSGTMLMGFRCVQPWQWGKRWGGHDMLWCEARRNGWVLETAPLAPFAGGGVDAELERFAEAVLTRTQLDTSRIDQPAPFMRYRNLTGRRLEFQWQPHKVPYQDHLKVDGRPLDFDDKILHRNPWVEQEVGRPLLVRDGRRRLLWDFDAWIRTELPE